MSLVLTRKSGEKICVFEGQQFKLLLTFNSLSSRTLVLVVEDARGTVLMGKLVKVNEPVDLGFGASVTYYGLAQFNRGATLSFTGDPEIIKFFREELCPDHTFPVDRKN